MKVVLFAGGLGTRISEETGTRPKPMVEIGGKPIIWHIMKGFSHYGFNDFIICLGYKGYVIKEYFMNYFLHNSDITIDLKNNKTEIHGSNSENFKVTLVETGLNTKTAGRLQQVQKYTGNEDFLLTYGDGVCDVNINDLVAFHQSHNKIATVTAIQLDARFGGMDLGSNGEVVSFREKAKDESKWINGGCFVFKIHANLDPKHRDRIAFLRVCSGRFERNKYYKHVRLERDIRFNNPYSFLARQKEVIEDAYPGDVVGLFDTGNFKIGDTLTEGEKFYFTGIPSFSPEIFKEVQNKDPMKTKQLEKGLLQLTDEGVAQLFTQFGGNKKIIGCVGELQFEVIQYRLLQEYGASVQMNSLPFYKACWLTSKDPKKLEDFIRFKQGNIAQDKDGHLVYLAQSEWFLNTERQNNPDIEFHFTSEIHK